jgi:peptidoglycan hydrolase-like protein with peptidoglycan-binding domain
MSLNPAENNVNGRPAIPGGPSATFVTIPYYITVHLGLPDDEAENIAVPFVDYIKNVASSELYPTWPENAIRANIHAIVSIALNRVFTQWYRTKGYNFDITNSTSYDMAYVKGRGVYDSISKIADEIFNDYIIKDQKKGEINPFFAQFCDGRISLCNGMYQWGSVDLANQGYSPEEILKYYYGDIGIVKNVPMGGESQLTYSGEPEKLGDSSIFVLIHQLSLNRVARNFPAIPAIDTVNGYFDESTENAVKEFQRIFKLPVTGIIDKATHYKLVYVYLAVSKVSEISAERSTLGEVLERTKYALLQGDVRPRVSALQYMLNILSTYNSTIPEVQITGTFDPHTRAAVIEFQKHWDFLQPASLMKKPGIQCTIVSWALWKQFLLSLYIYRISGLTA